MRRRRQVGRQVGDGSGAAGPTRRQALARLAALVPLAAAGACTTGGDPDTPVGVATPGTTPTGSAGPPPPTTPTSPTSPPGPTREQVLAGTAARDVRGLVQAYDRTLARHPGLAPVVRRLRAEAVAHLDALLPVAAGTPAGAAADAPGAAVPAVPDAALDALAARERAHADARPAQTVGAGADLARLLAQVGAAEAVHAVLLGRPAAPPAQAAPAPTGGPAVTALRAALAGEHAAVYGFGVVGAHAGREHVRAAAAAYDGHLAQRDRLAAALAAAGEEPELPSPAYALPLRVDGPPRAVQLAAVLEDRLCGPYAALVAAAEGDLRRTAARWLQASAVAAATWRGGPVRPFPGDPARG